MFLNTQENFKNAPLFTLSYSHELIQESQLLTELIIYLVAKWYTAR